MVLIKYIYYLSKSTVNITVNITISIEYEKGAAIIFALDVRKTPKEIIKFLKLQKSLVYQVKRDFDAAETFSPSFKKYPHCCNIKRISHLSLQSLTRMFTSRQVHVCLSQKNGCTLQYHLQNSHRRPGDEVLCHQSWLALDRYYNETRKVKAAPLLNNLKHKTASLIRFFSAKKNQK